MISYENYCLQGRAMDSRTIKMTHSYAYARHNCKNNLRYGIAAGKNFKSSPFTFDTIFKLILQLQVTWILQNYLKLTLMTKLGP